MNTKVTAARLVARAEYVHRTSMLETERLVLRKWRQEDPSQVAPILGDTNVMEFSEYGVLNSEQQKDWFEKALAGRTDDLLSTLLAIAQKPTGDVIGYITLSSDPNRNEQGDVEIGFRLSRHAWGKGYATEAAACVLRSTNKVPSISRIVAIVDPSNTRSIRVLKKLGMSQAGEVMFDGYDHPDAMYELKLPLSEFWKPHFERQSIQLKRR